MKVPLRSLVDHAVIFALVGGAFMLCCMVVVLNLSPAPGTEGEGFWHRLQKVGPLLDNIAIVTGVSGLAVGISALAGVREERLYVLGIACGVAGGAVVPIAGGVFEVEAFIVMMFRGAVGGLLGTRATRSLRMRRPAR